MKGVKSFSFGEESKQVGALLYQKKDVAYILWQ